MSRAWRTDGVRRVQLLLCAAAALASFGCDQRRPEPPTAASANEPSPNASILPAPLAAGPIKPASRDAGHAPAGEPVSDALLLEPPHAIREDDILVESLELKPAPGLTLQARFRWLEPPPPRSTEGNADAIGKARERASFDVEVELSTLGRMRLVFDARSFPFAAGTELRARDDRFGQVLLWPNASAYTPIPPGTLRALLGELRVDMSPLSDANVVALGAGNMLGLATQKQRLETSVGRLELEQGSAPTPSSGSTLWCRLLVELVGAAPDVSVCKPELLALRAEYTWASGSRFELEVGKLIKRSELAAEGLAVPPAGAELRRGELPSPPFVALMEERELSDFRTRALPPPEKPDPAAPKLGLVFQNRSDGPRFLLVDGAPIVWVRANAEWLVSGLKPGRYAVQARDFFGAESSPLKTLELPARFLVGDEPDRTQH